MKVFAALILLFGSLPPLNATITVQLQADLLQDGSGSAVPQSSLFLLVADTERNGFGAILEGLSTAVGSNTRADGDDYVVFRGAVGTNTGTNGVLFDTASGLNSSLVPNGLWDTGDPLALIWFSTLPSTTPTFQNGAAYGVYTRNTVVDGSAAWVTTSFSPSSNISLGFYTTNGTTLGPGSNAPALGRTSAAVVPEPTSTVLILAGLLGIIGKRHRLS
ncbi:MAG TPA: PEP-CTERM sorting domain-containing protein [Chthoniobacteraceae bacterium]